LINKIRSDKWRWKKLCD